MSNVPLFQRQFFKAIWESLTTEEVASLFKLGRAIAGVLANVDINEIRDATKAFNQGWELMRKYRTTGEL